MKLKRKVINFYLYINLGFKCTYMYCNVQPLKHHQHEKLPLSAWGGECKIETTHLQLSVTEGGDIWLFITPQSPKFYQNVSLLVRLTTLGYLGLSVKTFQTLIVIYGRCNFVYHHWKCTSIYRSLCYPFRSLQLCIFMELTNLKKIC